MPAFTYKALQSDGGVVEGVLEAGGRQQALREIEGRGLKPIRLTEGAQSSNRSSGHPKPESRNGNNLSSESDSKSKARPASPEGKATNSLWHRPRQITPRILENFTRLLSSLLAAGVPFSRALGILHREAVVPTAKAKWKELHDRVVDGMSLSSAMALSPETFPRVYVAMVEAGETGGFLDLVLAQIADFQSREKELKSKVAAALIYPAVLLVLAIAVIIFLLVFFIPKFQLVFKGFNAELPLITQIIVGISEIIRSYGLLVAAAIAALVWVLRSWLKSERGRRAWEGSLLKVPAIGSLTAQYAMARFCRMLGTLLGAGVPLISGLNVARRSIGNQILVDAVSDSIDRVKEGQPLGVSLAKNRSLFPGAVIEMISVAEESGRLDKELVRIAGTTETDLDRELKSVVSLAEPLLLFLIAAFVGTIFIGMLIPIFSLQDHIK
ncbi:MAG: type II secretion system F family protein [Opitutaceae bacterium]|nr:type II secretion system F family protein [Opitutaceae bacterium]